MGVFIFSRNAALSTSNDHFTLIGASNRTLRIKRITAVGMGTASAANEILVQHSTGGTTGGGAITAAPLLGANTAATQAFTVNTTWSSQPSLTSNTIVARIGLNANGGFWSQRWGKGDEPELRGTDQISVRSASGTSNALIEFEVEEL